VPIINSYIALTCRTHSGDVMCILWGTDIIHCMFLNEKRTMDYVQNISSSQICRTYLRMRLIKIHRSIFSIFFKILIFPPLCSISVEGYLILTGSFVRSPEWQMTAHASSLSRRASVFCIAIKLNCRCRDSTRVWLPRLAIDLMHA
jgi:hypothetical protein